MDGGAGTDLLYISNGNYAYFMDMASGATNQAGESFTGFEWVTCGGANDTIIGSGDSNRIWGNGGDDVLRGGGGFDILVGGAGNDVLQGGDGSDRLMGRIGEDIFQFLATTDSTTGGIDWIDGFDGAGVSGGDRINVQAIDANDLIAGNQGFTWRGTAPGGAGTAWAGTSGTDTLVYFNTDADAVAEMTIRILDGAVVASAYTSGDFVL